MCMSMPLITCSMDLPLYRPSLPPQFRSAFDTKTFYKKFDSTKFPKHFHVGTVVEGAADWYSARLARRDRRSTFTEEILSDPMLARARRKRYTKLQEENSRFQRKKPKNSSNPRIDRRAPRPKH